MNELLHLWEVFMIFEKRKFLVVMALFTVSMIFVSALTGEIDMAEGVMEEAEVLKIDYTPSLGSESFDIIANEIESKNTEKTEVVNELTTEVKEELTTEPVTEEVTTEKVTEKQQYAARYVKAPTQSKTPVAKSTTEQVTTTKPTEETTEPVEIVESTEAPTEDIVVDLNAPTVSDGAELIVDVEETEAPTEVPKKKSMYYSMTEDEIYTFASLIYLEAGSTSYKCQCAVASVVINLMVKEGKSLNACIKTPGRFSVASRVYRTKPSSTSLEVARKIATDGPTLPSYVIYFRNNHYFSWAKAYCHIDNVYFSY